MATEYQADFKLLKARVGIDDVAYALGYHLNRKAGVGKFIQLELGEGATKQDTIVVGFHKSKANQIYKRHGDGRWQDVIAFIRENIHSFNVSGANDWQKVAKVLSQFANMPEPVYNADREYVRKAPDTPTVYDKDRYDVKPLDSENIPGIFGTRGLFNKTVRAFLPYIRLIRDMKNSAFNGYNIGFPYSSECDGEILGYEIRGSNGFKSKAAGSNSSTAAWVAEFHDNLPPEFKPSAYSNPQGVKNVFFFESSFDAMAFFQMNRLRLGSDFAFVSTGGQLSDNQVLNVMHRFPAARFVDCFDNDIAGRMYGLKLISLAEKLPMVVEKTQDGNIQVSARDKTIIVNPAAKLMPQIAKPLSLRYAVKQWSAPEGFKDWNDCAQGKRITPSLGPNKFDRDENLAALRKTGPKL